MTMIAEVETETGTTVNLVATKRIGPKKTEDVQKTARGQNVIPSLKNPNTVRPTLTNSRILAMRSATNVSLDAKTGDDVAGILASKRPPTSAKQQRPMRHSLLSIQSCGNLLQRC
jgi:hypothetical protein